MQCIMYSLICVKALCLHIHARSSQVFLRQCLSWGNWLARLHKLQNDKKIPRGFSADGSKLQHFYTRRYYVHVTMYICALHEIPVSNFNSAFFVWRHYTQSGLGNLGTKIEPKHIKFCQWNTCLFIWSNRWRLRMRHQIKHKHNKILSMEYVFQSFLSETQGDNLIGDLNEPKYIW